MKISKRYLLILLVITFGLFAFGCGVSTYVKIPEQTFVSNYAKMFDTVINAGMELGYHPEYKDEKLGVIKLFRRGWGSITVKFVKPSQGQPGFNILGDTGEFLNPTMRSHVKRIENAILQAAGGKN